MCYLYKCFLVEGACHADDARHARMDADRVREVVREEVLPSELAKEACE